MQTSQKARSDATRRRGSSVRSPEESNGYCQTDQRRACACDPRAVFKEPIEVLACADLDDAHKRRILECWRQDALELQTADDEAMGGGEVPMLKRVLDAIRTLGGPAPYPAAGPLSRLS
jgi:hypothetical protein